MRYLQTFERFNENSMYAILKHSKDMHDDEVERRKKREEEEERRNNKKEETPSDDKNYAIKSVEGEEEGAESEGGEESAESE